MNKINNKPFYKILLTIGLLIFYRLISFITIPWIDTSTLTLLSAYSLFSYVDEFNGGTLSSLSFTAVGISSYITASIIIQMLAFGIPKLEEISKQPGGEKIIKKITMILGVILSFITSIGLITLLQKQVGILTNDAWYVYICIALFHCLGTLVSIWIGETIEEQGFGSGVSLLIALNVAISLPSKLSTISYYGSMRAIQIIGVILAMFLLVIILETAEERIPVQYSSRISTTSIYKSKEPYIPIKLNISSVMPIIFATTIFQLGTTIIELGKFENIPQWVNNCFTYGSSAYMVINCLLIIIFTFFYSYIIFKPEDIAKSLQINEGVIPGVRPGSETEKYLSKVSLKLNIIGSLYMCVTSIIPMICFNLLNFTSIQVTSLIILVGVGLDISNKIAVDFLCIPSKKVFYTPKISKKKITTQKLQTL